jgi:hypothetical protein
MLVLDSIKIKPLSQVFIIMNNLGNSFMKLPVPSIEKRVQNAREDVVHFEAPQ